MKSLLDAWTDRQGFALPARAKLVTTRDGSPSLILENQNGNSEMMHNSMGAFSETCYVYGPVVENVLTQSLPPHFLSLGLGLGYVEMLACAHVLAKAPALAHELFIETFEAEAWLREEMSVWLLKKDPVSPLPFDFIAMLFENHHALPKNSIRELLSNLYSAKRFVMGESLTSSTPLRNNFSGIFFDAFSSEMCPDLWDEDLLAHVLENAPASHAVFATYASRTALKKILKKHNFRLVKRRGFGGKREATLAVR